MMIAKNNLYNHQILMVFDYKWMLRSDQILFFIKLKH